MSDRSGPFPLVYVSQLRVGDIVQHGPQGEPRVVIATNGRLATAVNTATVGNVEEWLIINRDPEGIYILDSRNMIG